MNTELQSAFDETLKKDREKKILTNVKYAFHVTRTKNLGSLLIEGLDQRLASKGLFGNGLYFADDPRKSNYYWEGNEKDLKMVLRVCLAPGRIKFYPPNTINPHLKREPKGFDSVQGELKKNIEYVIYNSKRVNIEYIITYKELLTYDKNTS